MAGGDDRIHQLALDYTAAWNTGSPASVAAFFSEDGQIVINGGEPRLGRAGVAAMAAEFFADIPDLTLFCDGVRSSGTHTLYLWTFTGIFGATGNQLHISGWEEWELDESSLIASSRGWFDAADYGRQAWEAG